MENPNYLETDTSSDKEKHKKSKSFIRFLAQFIQRSRTDKNYKDEQLNLLEIIRDYKTNESNKDSDDEIVSREPLDDELSEVEDYIHSSIETNIENLKGEELNQDEADKIYIETTILFKIKERIDNDQDIDIDEIISETAQELSQQDEAKIKQTTNSNEGDLFHNRVVVARSDKTNKRSTSHKPMVTSTNSTDSLKNKKNNISNNIDGTDRSIPNVLTPVGLADKYTVPTVNKHNTQSTSYNKNILKKINLAPRIALERPANSNKPKTILESSSFKKLQRIEHSSENIGIKAQDKKILIESNKGILLDSEILRKAEKIYLDKVNLKKIYENSDLKISDLRKILSGESKKKSIRKDVKRALMRRNNNYSEVVSNIKRHGYSNPSKIQKAKSKLIPKSYPKTEKSSKIHPESYPKQSSKGDETKHRPLLTILVLVIVFLVVLLIFVY